MTFLRVLALWFYRKTMAPMPNAEESALLLARIRRAVEGSEVTPEAVREIAAAIDRRLQEIEATGEPAKRRADQIEAAIVADPARFRRALGLEVDRSTVSLDPGA